MRRIVILALAMWPITASAQVLCNGDDIRQKVCVLQQGFRPGTDANPSPKCEPPPGGVVSDPDKMKIQQAFELARLPQNAPRAAGLASDLCGLTNIFVAPGAPHSWGKWNNPLDYEYQPALHNLTFIAVHPHDLNVGLAAKQDEHLSAPPFNQNDRNEAKHEEQVRDTTSETLGLFYVLAHEMGHVKWHRLPDAGNCGKNDFSRHSWRARGTNPRWTDFGVLFPMQALMPNIPDPRPDFAGRPAPGPRLHNIHMQGMATSLAAANPEEDFVETYAIRAVMRGSPNTTLDLVTRNPGGNPMRDRVNSMHGDLTAKMNCVNPLLQ